MLEAAKAKLNRHLVARGGAHILQAPVLLSTVIFKACNIEQSHEQALYNYDAGPIADEDDRLYYKGQEEMLGEYWDDVNGGWLDKSKVEKARKEELDWILKQTVFEKVPMAQVDGRLLTLKWVVTVKSDGRYRSRLVVREIRRPRRRRTSWTHLRCFL